MTPQARQELRRLCNLPQGSAYDAVMADVVDGCLSLLDEVGQQEAMQAVLQSYISLLETIKNSRKGYVGDHTIYSVQLNESAIDSRYAQVKEVYEERV